MSYRTVAATLVALSALSAVVLAIAVNIATGGTAPPWLPAAYAWPVVIVCGVISVSSGFVSYLLNSKTAAASIDSNLTYDPQQSFPNFLPERDSYFAGRRTELKEAVGDSQENNSNLQSGRGSFKLVVSGAGGVGKTEFALAVIDFLGASRAAARLFVDLQTHGRTPRSAIDGLTRLLLQLGQPTETVPVDVEDARDLYLRLTANIPVVLLLDDVASEEQARSLLPENQNATIVLTSRFRLAGLLGMDLIVLSALERSESIEVLMLALGQHRVEREMRAASELAAYCGDLPLALRISAARLKSRPEWNISYLADALRDERNRLNVLKVGDREVRAALNASYTELAPREAFVLRRCAFLPGAQLSTSLIAAACELTVAEAQTSLERLTDVNLLDSMPQQQYQLHDLTRLLAREYAEDRETPEQIAAAVRRFIKQLVLTLKSISRFTDPDVDANSASFGSKNISDERSAIDYLSREHDTILASVKVAGEQGELQLICELGRSIRVFGMGIFTLNELLNVQHRAVEAAERLGDSETLARALLDLGRSYRHHGLAAEAEVYLRRSRVQAEISGSIELLANIGYFLGHALRESNRLDEAEREYLESLDRFERLEWRAKIAAVTANLGLLRDYQNKSAEGLRELRRSIELFSTGQVLTLHDRREEAWAHQATGGVLSRLGRTEEALPELKESLSKFRELGDRQGEAYGLRNLGDLYVVERCYQEAIASYIAALDVCRTIGERRGEAQALASLAVIRSYTKNLKLAMKDLNSYIAIAGEIGDRRSTTAIAGVLVKIARAWVYPGRPQIPRLR